MSDDILLEEKIKRRKRLLKQVKEGLIDRLNIYKKESQIDDDTPLFGNGLKLDSVDATEVLVYLNDEFNIQVSEGDDPSYMRTINNIVSFIEKKQDELNKETN